MSVSVNNPMDQEWVNTIHTAFPDQYPRVVTAVQSHPDPVGLARLFLELAQSRTSSTLVQQPVTATPSTSNRSKKRKLENGSAAAPSDSNGPISAAILDPSTVFECSEVSFQIPARKKLKLQIVEDPHHPVTKEIRLFDLKTSEVEHTLHAGNIDQAFCLPVPEKTTRQCNFVVFPKAGAIAADGNPCEQLVFTLNEAPAKLASAAGLQYSDEDDYVTVTRSVMDAMLKPYGRRVVLPDAAEFASSMQQAHRKGEKAYHVKAHRGSKDGFLFFLSTGIIFGFKKPLAFFPFSSIESISYTSVLQRTFNLVIGSREASEGGEDAEVKEVEFSMIDQADFAGIDEYVKRHGLNDASMAADRRAKAYNVNRDRKAEGNGDGAATAADGEGEDGQTELQKAEQLLQDQEDEEEEDYEASGGESDGEGEDSDEEEEGGEGYAEAGDDDGED